MTTSNTNRVFSYFFLFDFYHVKGTTDEQDLFPESIVYFYPPREDIKRQKLLDIGEMIGLIQYLKFELFSCTPSEFYYKKSLVTTEHYGRHSAFLILSKDRFTTDEATIHLTHILQIFNMLYGTLNHIHSIYSDINQMQTYLKQALTPIVEYVFNENRSIRNLFSAIDYAPLIKNNQRCLLHVKHFLNYLQSTYRIQNGFFTYEKRLLYSTFDADTTFYLQIILTLRKHLPKNEIYIPLESQLKLKNGVSLLRIFIRQSPSLQTILNAVNGETEHQFNHRITTNPISINHSIITNDYETTSVNFTATNPAYSISNHSNRRYTTVIQEDLAGSSEETTNDTDRTEDTSPPSKTETDSVVSSINNRRSNNSKDNSTSTFLQNSNNRSLTDDQKIVYQYVRPRSGTLNHDLEESIKPNHERTSSNGDLDNVIFVQIQRDDDDIDSCGECCDEDAICLPPVSLHTNFQRTRQRTITSYSDLNDIDNNNNNNNDQHEGFHKWGDTPEINDEIECDELVLYVQQNARMIFVGILEKNLLTEDYLQKLWCSILTGIADMDRDIQVIPISGETSKHNSDIRFHFNDNSHQVQYEQLTDTNPNYYKIPSSDTACMAFTARKKMLQNPDRRMMGFSRGNNLISLNRYLPDRVTYFCRRFQEPH